MTEVQLHPLISGGDIKSELRKRRSKDVYQTVRASKASLLNEKVKLEEADGWRIDRINKKSIRMALAKPSSEQLEDELWCLLAEMGFKELSFGRQFHISVDKKLPARQVDVFAKDDETALVIECTQSEEPKSKSMMPLIEKLMAIREGVHKAIVAHYGRKVQLKAKIIIATRNIIWKSVDVTKCKEAGISILTDDELDYYKILIQHIKQASRYQLLAHMFGGTGIGGLAKNVVATQGTMGGVRFYNFLIRPYELLKIAYIGHKSSRNIDNIETYQRMLQKNRLKNIAEYIKSGGKFPTNIVVNIKTSKGKGLKFDKKEQVGSESYGVLHLPANYAVAWIIDGQHRLYGYAHAAIEDEARDEKSTLPVLAFENLTAVEEMKMFIDINSKQVKVSTGLLVELYADLHWGSPHADERHLALLARIAARLNSVKTSAICQRVVVTGKKKNSYRCLTQTSLSDGLYISRLVGWIRKEEYIAGPLTASDSKYLEKSLNKAMNILSQCLAQFAKAMPDHWELGDAPGGYLCTNNSIRAIFLLIKDICDHVAKKTGNDLSQLTDDEVVDDIIPLLQPVIEYFKNANSQQISSFRRMGSSLAAVKQQSQGMGVFVRQAFPDFNPAGLQEHIDSRDEAGTEVAATKINQINRRIFNYVMAALQNEFGENKDNWWTKGIPVIVRKKCAEEWETNDREKPEESYLYLIDYQAIAIANWELMKDVFALGSKNIDDRKNCVKWIKGLNDIRRITHHPEKGILSVDQVRYVDEITDKVEKYFV